MKKILCIMLSFVIIFLSVIMSYYTATAAEPSPSPLMLNNSNPLESGYNMDVAPQNFTVEDKTITGNEKHFLTWDNPEGCDGYKVEVFTQIYIKYIDTADVALDEVDLSTLPWREYAFPLMQCCVSDAADKGAVINFSDVWQNFSDDQLNAYGADDYGRLNALCVALSGMPFVGTPLEQLSGNIAKVHFMLNNEQYANYIKYSRVKYYVRYVSFTGTGDMHFNPGRPAYDESDGLYHYYCTYRIYSDMKKEYFVFRYEFTIKKAVVAFAWPSFRNEYNSYEWAYLVGCCSLSSDKSFDMNVKQTFMDTFSSNLDEVPKYVNYSVNQASAGENSDGNWDYGSIIDTNIPYVYYPVSLRNTDRTAVREKAYIISHEYSDCRDFTKLGIAGITTNLIGKMVENDTFVPGSGGAGSSGTDAPPPSVPTSGSSIFTTGQNIRYKTTTGAIVPQESTDLEGVEGWLEKIYKRLGRMFAWMVSTDVADLVGDWLSDKKDGLLDALDDVSDAAMKKFPFCVVALPSLVLNMLVADPVVPEFTYTLDWDGITLGGYKVDGFSHDVHIDLKDFDGWIKILRKVMVALYCLSLIGRTVDTVKLIKDGGISD